MLYVVFLLVFLLGTAIGSFLNVCAYRLPYEKSVLWPGSRCGSCYQPVRWYDNIPLLSYWLLRGRCRDCGATFSSRYFWVELLTGLAFAGLFYLEVVRNVLNMPLVQIKRAEIAAGLIPPRLFVVFAYHAALVSFLLAAALCDLEHMEIPLSLTITGTLVGLIGSMLFAWPFPENPPPVSMNIEGLYPWPVWHRLPAWMPPGSWQLGLATGLAGAAMGMLILRGIRFLFGVGRGMEGLGVGDADLMMMAGAFVGWQVVLLAFFIAVFPGLILGIVQVVLRGDQALPFGPALAIGVLVTLLAWPQIGARYQIILQKADMLGTMAAVGAVLLLVISFALRLIRGSPKE